MRSIALIVMLFGSASTLHAQTTEEEDIAAVKTALIEMWAAIEKGDVEAYAQYVHPDYTAFGEFDLYLAEGKALEVSKVAGWLAQAENVHTEMHQPQVTIRGEVAWMVYYWTDSGTDGGVPFSSRGKSTRIFVKEEGKWLCIHAHFTAVP